MEPFIAEIIMFGGNFAPRGWAFCDGQLLAIAQNQALFSILGTTYGGDGRVTFALPDLRGRVPMHAGNGPGLSSRRLGERGGLEAVILVEGQIPSHDHPATAAVAVSTAAGGEVSPGGQFIASHAGAFNEDATAAQSLAGASATVQNAGGGQSHDNIQPYNTINFIIALQGTFPSRS